MGTTAIALFSLYILLIQAESQAVNSWNAKIHNGYFFTELYADTLHKSGNFDIYVDFCNNLYKKYYPSMKQGSSYTASVISQQEYNKIYLTVFGINWIGATSTKNKGIWRWTGGRMKDKVFWVTGFGKPEAKYYSNWSYTVKADEISPFNLRNSPWRTLDLEGILTYVIDDYKSGTGRWNSVGFNEGQYQNICLRSPCMIHECSNPDASSSFGYWPHCNKCLCKYYDSHKQRICGSDSTTATQSISVTGMTQGWTVSLGTISNTVSLSISLNQTKTLLTLTFTISVASLNATATETMTGTANITMTKSLPIKSTARTVIPKVKTITPFKRSKTRTLPVGPTSKPTTSSPVERCPYNGGTQLVSVTYPKSAPSSVRVAWPLSDGTICNLDAKVNDSFTRDANCILINHCVTCDVKVDGFGATVIPVPTTALPDKCKDLKLELVLAVLQTSAGSAAGDNGKDGGGESSFPLIGDPTTIEAHLAAVLLVWPCAGAGGLNAAVLFKHFLSPLYSAGPAAAIVVHVILSLVILGGHAGFTFKKKYAEPFTDVWPRTFFPSLSFMIALWLYPGVAWGCGQLAREGTSGLAVVIGCLFLLFIPVFGLYVMFRVAFALPRQYHLTEGQSMVQGMIFPNGMWPIADSRALLGIRGFTNGRGRNIMFAARCALTVLVCGLAASPKTSSCGVQGWVVCLVLLVAAAGTAGLRPYEFTLRTILTTLSLVACALVAASVAAESSGLRVFGLILIMLCTFARLGHLIWAVATNIPTYLHI